MDGNSRYIDIYVEASHDHRECTMCFGHMDEYVLDVFFFLGGGWYIISK